MNNNQGVRIYEEMDPERGECSFRSFEEKSSLKLRKQSEKQLKEVVRMLDVENPPSVIKEGTLRMELCINNGIFSLEDLERIASQRGVLEGVVSLLSLDMCHTLQHCALRACYSLCKSETNKIRLISSPGAIEGIVNLFSRSSDTIGQKRSLHVLKLLSESPEVNLELGCIPGIMSSLEDVIKRGGHHVIHNYAVHVYRLLIIVQGLNRRSEICPTDIRIVLSMFLDENPNFFLSATSVVSEYLITYEKENPGLKSLDRVIADMNVDYFA